MRRQGPRTGICYANKCPRRAGSYPLASVPVKRFFPQEPGFIASSPLRAGLCGPQTPRPLPLFFEAGPQGWALAGQTSPLVSPSASHSPAASLRSPLADLSRERLSVVERSRTQTEDSPERFRRIPTALCLRKEPKVLPILGLPSPSENTRSFPSGRPAGLLEAAAAPCWMLCSLSEENPPASPEPRYREGRRFPRGGG